jgi:predicted HTH transcriptional regulator
MREGEKVALYDDRLEVTSPGGLCYGLTLEEALEGRSRQRNRAIAEVFNQIGFIEAWGNGLQNIKKEAGKYELPEPEFIEMPETFRVNLYRKPLSVENGMKSGKTLTECRRNVGYVSENVGEMSENIGENDGGVGELKERIMKEMLEDKRISASLLAKKLSVTQRTVERYIKELREDGVLIRHGAARSGYWEVRKWRD